MSELRLDTLSLGQETSTTIEKAANIHPVQKIDMSPTQPHSLLHAIPQELQDAIFALVVVSPTLLPARVRLLDAPTAPTTTSQGETDESATQVLVTPTQPALAQVDRSTRASALRLFYAENNFLFREHPCDRNPLRSWVHAIIHDGNAYSNAAKLVRSVVLEKRARKSCSLLGSQPRRGSGQHVYRLAITAQGDGALSVDLQGDLAGICACAVRTAALLRPFQPAGRFTSVWPGRGEKISEALAFAVDTEESLFLAQPCTWQYCDTAALTACSECGLWVHRNEKLGNYLLQWYESTAERMTAIAARDAAREKERLEREAEREAQSEALRVAREAEEEARSEVKRVAREAGSPARDGCVVM